MRGSGRIRDGGRLFHNQQQVQIFFGGLLLIEFWRDAKHRSVPPSAGIKVPADQVRGSVSALRRAPLAHKQVAGSSPEFLSCGVFPTARRLRWRLLTERAIASEDFGGREPQDTNEFTDNRNEHRPRVSALESHHDQTRAIAL